MNDQPFPERQRLLAENERLVCVNCDRPWATHRGMRPWCMTEDGHFGDTRFEPKSEPCAPSIGCVNCGDGPICETNAQPALTDEQVQKIADHAAGVANNFDTIVEGVTLRAVALDDLRLRTERVAWESTVNAALGDLAEILAENERLRGVRALLWRVARQYRQVAEIRDQRLHEHFCGAVRVSRILHSAGYDPYLEENAVEKALQRLVADRDVLRGALDRVVEAVRFIAVEDSVGEEDEGECVLCGAVWPQHNSDPECGRVCPLADLPGKEAE